MDFYGIQFFFCFVAIFDNFALNDNGYSIYTKLISDEVNIISVNAFAKQAA